MEPNNLVTTNDSFMFVLNSRTATSFLNETMNSHVRFDFEQSLNFDSTAIKNSCSVVQFNAPNSLYNVNQTNSFLSMTLNGVAVTLQISYGNYNASSFAKYFNTQLAAKGFSIALNQITNCYTITNTVANFSINPASTCYAVMGFAKNTTYATSPFSALATSYTLALPFTCNFNGYLSFNIHFSNLGTQNMDSYTGSTSTIIESIPVVPTSNVISFLRQNNFSFRVFQTTIDYIDISLKDDFGNYIDFNNQHWNLVLCFNSMTDLARFNHNTTFHSVLDGAYNNLY